MFFIWNSGRIGISDEYIGTSWEIETLPLVYLIPSLSGPGVCTNALLEALVQVHNGFIDHFQFVLKRRQKSKKKSVKHERLMHGDGALLEHKTIA